jgi:predicted DNA-binding transcriptional regulator YafY
MQPFEIKRKKAGGGTGNGVKERVVRVLKTAWMLQKNPWTVDELAERFAISRRTVYRDLKLIELAELPLVTQHGEHGYRLLPRSLDPLASDDPPARPALQM